jgi:hypothetical protein
VVSDVAYSLTRITPQGVEKSQGPFDTVRGAAVAAGRVLHDNGAAHQAEAQRFGVTLARKALGTEWAHTESGYRFRIDRVEGGEQ